MDLLIDKYQRHSLVLHINLIYIGGGFFQNDFVIFKVMSV